VETQPCSGAKKVLRFATVRNPSNKLFVHWRGTPLDLQSKDSSCCETAPVNAPTAATEGNLKKKKELATKFLDFISLDIRLLEKLYK